MLTLCMHILLKSCVFCFSFPYCQAFIEPTVSFSDKKQFRQHFCLRLVREGIVISFINHVLDTCHVRTCTTLLQTGSSDLKFSELCIWAIIYFVKFCGRDC